MALNFLTLLIAFLRHLTSLLQSVVSISRPKSVTLVVEILYNIGFTIFSFFAVLWIYGYFS